MILCRPRNFLDNEPIVDFKVKLQRIVAKLTQTLENQRFHRSSPWTPLLIPLENQRARSYKKPRYFSWASSAQKVKLDIRIFATEKNRK